MTVASPSAEARPPMAAIRLHRDGWGRIVLTGADGRQHPGVMPVRAFPLTDAERWISLLSPEGHEVLMIDSPADLDPETRAFLLAELGSQEFLPVVRRIHSVSSDNPPCQWEIETDRGPTTFTLDSEDHLRKLGPSRVIITDSNGVRYDLPDRSALDSRSERLLRKFL